MTLLKSWVASANDPETDFPLNNLPYGRYLQNGHLKVACVAIGDRILDLRALERTGLIGLDGCGDFFQTTEISGFMEAGPKVWSALRARLTELLVEGSEDRSIVEDCLQPMASVQLALRASLA